MRLIHTADVHLDMCFPSAGMPAGFGKRRRQSLRDVFHAIVQRAGAWPADALLIAGDLFEIDRVTRDTVAFLRAEFEAIPHVPVFIAPGNHDPYLAHSPYAVESWPANVTIFDRPDWVAHALEERGLTVHGFAFDGPEVSVNPFGSLDVSENGHVHVAVAHGSERGHQPPHKVSYAPFDAPDAALDALSYLALGHFHAVTPLDGDYPTTMSYSGTPEGHGFGETGPRHYLEVEIEDGRVSVEAVPSSRVEYSSHTIDCSAFTTSHEVVEAIRGLAPDDQNAQILRVVLTGKSSLDWGDLAGDIYHSVAPEFEALELIDDTTPEEDFADLAEQPTSLGGFARRLNGELEDATDERQKRLLSRARSLGVSAFRGHELHFSELEGE